MLQRYAALRSSSGGPSLGSLNSSDKVHYLHSYVILTP